MRKLLLAILLMAPLTAHAVVWTQQTGYGPSPNAAYNDGANKGRLFCTARGLGVRSQYSLSQPFFAGTYNGQVGFGWQVYTVCR